MLPRSTLIGSVAGHERLVRAGFLRQVSELTATPCKEKLLKLITGLCRSLSDVAHGSTCSR